MKRRVLVTLCAVGALSALIFGVVSYWKGVPAAALWISDTDDNAPIRLAMIDGTLHLVFCSTLQGARVVEARFSFAGFYCKETSVGRTHARGIGAPFWGVAVLLSAYPAWVLQRGPLRRRRRRRRGLCVACGYNLTGNVSGICPECSASAPLELQSQGGVRCVDH